jgi:uncharacterized protein
MTHPPIPRVSKTTVPLGNGDHTAAMHYHAERPTGDTLVLGHGAGAGQQHPWMVAIASGLASRGVDVLTFDFRYMHERRRLPDRTPVLEHCFRSVVGHVQEHSTLSRHRLFLGGKSMGGRMATHLGAQGLDKVAGIIVLGYPLHPPGKPQQLRTAHFASLAVPLLIVQGERDPFGTPAELTPFIGAVPALVTLHAVSGGDHSLSVRGRTRDEILAPILDVIRAWMDARVLR